jgi:hypothetical protein
MRMSFEMHSQLKSELEKTVPTKDGIAAFLGALGYPLVPEKEQLLDSDVLFQQKDMREKVSKSYKLFSQRAQWVHPVSKQTFDVEATIMLFELVDEQTLRSRWPFEIARYVVRFGLRSAQGLFFFVAPNSRSFVVSAYTESLDVPERVQVRRLVVDLDNIARTDLESLGELFYSLLTPATIVERFRSALPYLKVGQAFFKEYHNLFQILSKRLLKVFGAKAKAEAYGYAQRLLGRITFLYFLQRKGWLDKDRAYLKKRTKGLDGKGLMKFLYELFDILNTEGYEDKSKGAIPYLNGSLFEKEPYSEAQMKQLMDACASCVRDVLNVFDQYNFTISESTPLDKEVAVDPELLGSLFESMLPEAERGDKGTFYTHQEEMLFMAREALRVYLSRFPNLLTQDQVFYLVYGSELAETQKIEPKVAREVKDVLRQVKILDPAVGSGGFLMAALQTILEIRARLNGIIGAMEQAYDMKLEIIENNLFGVDIENEAIELARLRLWLALVVDESIENVRPLPNLDYNLHQGDSLKIPEFEKKLRQTKITVDPTIRVALLKQIAATREEYSRSHGKAKETVRVELEGALRKLLELETGIRQPKVLPFSYQFFFADVMASGGFDIVLMNPPYIQQEDIGKLPGQNPDTYKSEIANDAKLLTDNNFSPNKQSDISVYFHIRSLSLLKEGGAAVVIATNKWLDTRYGVPLQEYLLKHSAIDFVFDSSRRSFSADVNTVITIIRKTHDLVLKNLVRFVCFKIPFENVSDKLLREIIFSNNEGLFLRDSYRLVVRTQKHLYEDGVTEEEETSDNPKNQRGRKKRIVTKKKENNETYVGTKWGNLHLRAPPIYYEILKKAGDKLRPLGKIYRIMRGITSGNIDFFVLTRIGTKGEKLVRCRNGFDHEFLLEKDFCKPVLRDPEDVSSYYLEADNISYHIFLCRYPRTKLKGTYALDYINWAETSPDAMTRVLRGKNRGKLVRIMELATVKSRQEWYQLPDVKPSKILVPIIIKNRHVVPLCNDYVYGTNNYHLIYCENKLTDLWLYLNSSIFRLFMELNGRWEGAGALQMMVYEYKQCPSLDPLPPFSQGFKRFEQFKSRVAYRFMNIAEQGPLELEQEDRKELDELVLTAMGFTEKEEREKALKEIYSWLLERVRERLEKPKTAPESVAKAIGKKRAQTDLREFQ